MNKVKKVAAPRAKLSTAKSRGSEVAHIHLIHTMELARGRSHITSMLSPESRARAVSRVLGDFGNLYGIQKLVAFREAIASELDGRNAVAAALAVRDFQVDGCCHAAPSNR